MHRRAQSDGPTSVCADMAAQSLSQQAGKYSTCAVQPLPISKTRLDIHALVKGIRDAAVEQVTSTHKLQVRQLSWTLLHQLHRIPCMRRIDKERQTILSPCDTLIHFQALPPKYLARVLVKDAPHKPWLNSDEENALLALDEAALDEENVLLALDEAAAEVSTTGR
jgi:hypothetical protein